LSLLCARLCGKWTPVVEAGNTLGHGLTQQSGCAFFGVPGSWHVRAWSGGWPFWMTIKTVVSMGNQPSTGRIYIGVLTMVSFPGFSDKSIQIRLLITYVPWCDGNCNPLYIHDNFISNIMIWYDNMNLRWSGQDVVKHPNASQSMKQHEATRGFPLEKWWHLLWQFCSVRGDWTNPNNRWLIDVNKPLLVSWWSISPE
jgi:hypothetical protein